MYKLIKTKKELLELQEYLVDKQFIAFDCETTGLDDASDVIGFSICADVEMSYYVVHSYWDVVQATMIKLETLDIAKDFLASLVGKSLIMHNGVFDCRMVFNNFGVSLIESLRHDTMISGHLLDENRHNGLKERGVALYGESARDEQLAMKESVSKNGGSLTKANYELYKADCDLIGKYGAADAVLTLKLFYEDLPLLFEQKLHQFFYEEESMPLLRGPTYELNTAGLKVDPNTLITLKKSLEAECLEKQAFISAEIASYVAEEYPGTSKTNHFNIGSSKQLAWLLYIKLNNEFKGLTKGGKELCKAMDLKVPYTAASKRDFIKLITDSKGQIYQPAGYNYKTKKMGRPKKIGAPCNYIACGKDSLQLLKDKYRWVKALLEYAKALKLLNTYVEGIETRMRYGVIRPSFLQHGTTSGRYSSRNPNFQNLPRDDKRVKACIVSRPNKVFVGADYSQLEPRVFASFSEDERLLKCFRDGDDFYSVIGMEVFEKYDCSLKKDSPNSFAKKYPELRQIAKVIALSATYGTTAPKMAPALGKPVDEAQNIIDNYFAKFPSIKDLMVSTHDYVKEYGIVYNLFGRPRRIPDAKGMNKIYGESPHSTLPYEARNMLNLAVNHTIQSTASSIMNRAMIAFTDKIKEIGIKDCRIVMSIHDEIIVECMEADAKAVSSILKDAMENTVILPGVDLEAIPTIGKTLAELKS